MFKFLHAADIHLDSPLRGLEQYESAPVEQIRQATRRALENLTRCAIDEKVDFVLIAGDVYDGDWNDYNTGLFFVRQMGLLHEAGIRVYLIHGNHDAANKMTRSLTLPESVHTFESDEPLSAAIDDLGVMIHGQSFATAAVTDDLSLRYPAGERDLFNIGLLHTCGTGAEGHENYAPCTIDGLRGKQYDYWALGHIHKREMLREADPLIVFSGNIQGRHIRETGPKGCYLVEVDDQHRIVEIPKFIPLDVMRWERCEVFAGDCETAEETVDQFATELHRLMDVNGSLPLAVRVEITGASPAHGELTRDAEKWTNEIRGRATLTGADRVWIEKVRIGTQPQGSLSDLQAMDGPVGELLKVIAERNDGGDLSEWVEEELAELKRKLAAEVGESELEQFGIQSADRHREWLNAAGDMLVSRLLAERSAD